MRPGSSYGGARRVVFKVRQRADCSARTCYSPWPVAKVPKLHDDTFSSLLDRIGILREELVSIERSLERMKDAKSKRRKDLLSKPSRKITRILNADCVDRLARLPSPR